jgi:glycosyltransferase involved in cell wall biosynthesis
MDDAAPTASAPRRVRVAIVIDTVPPWSKGGRERRIAELLARLEVDEGLDLAVYTMRWWHRPPTGAVTYHAISPRLRLYVGERRSIVQALVFAIGSLQLLVRPLDVIVADHMPYLHLFPLRLVAWVRRVPLVVEWHEFWGPAYWKSYLGRAGAVGAALEAASLRLGDEVVADGGALADVLRSRLDGRPPVVTISNAVSGEHAWSVRPADDATELLFVGRLIGHKRADVAVRTVAALAEAHPHVRLGVVGVGPELETLRSLTAELGLESRVQWYGSIEDHDRVWSLVRGADVLLAPSEREGFGLAVAEALAVGTLAITVDAPGNAARALVEEGRTGSIVAPGDPEAMAAAVSRWLERRPPRAEVAAAFWGAHAELDWSSSAAAYAVLLRELGAEKPR